MDDRASPSAPARRTPRSRLNGSAAVPERHCSQMAHGDGLGTTEPDFDARARVDLRPRRKPPTHRRARVRRFPGLGVAIRRSERPSVLR